MNNHKTFYRFSIITLLQANKTKVFFNKLFVNNINNMSCNNIDSVAKKHQSQQTNIMQIFIFKLMQINFQNLKFMHKLIQFMLCCES